MQNQNQSKTPSALSEEFGALRAELRVAEAVGDVERAAKAKEAINLFLARNPELMQYASNKMANKVMKKKILTRVGIGLGVVALGIGGAIFARR